jgi:sigma-B regulation protein RsbU (phosphoserine phosphatase)
MSGTTLLLIVDECDTRLWETAKALVTDWQPDRRPRLVEATAEQICTRAGDYPATAAWLLTDRADADELLFTVTEALGEAHLPMALSAPDLADVPGVMLEPGVVHCPLGADPAEVRGVLCGMLGSAAGRVGLKQEVRMLRAQSTGMAGQFDKIDEELRMALKIQREFLPKQLPDVDGLAFDVLWRPACYVGGDIYDIQRLDEDHIGVFIADAVGHGMPAALMTVYIKQSMVTRQITPGIGAGYRIVPPGEAIAGLNRAMIEQDAGAASLGTAAYAVINTATQRVTVARAGHPAPLLLRGDGRTQWLEPDGAMLGIFPEEVFEELTYDLDDGDRFLLYSDGFEVAFPGKGSKGRLANEHYCTEFEGLRRGTGQEALEFLQERIDLQSGSLNQRDDLTVVSTSVRALARVNANRAEADRVETRRVA